MKTNKMKTTTLLQKNYPDSNIEFSLIQDKWDDNSVNYSVWIYGESKVSFESKNLKEATKEFDRIFEEQDLTGCIK